MRPEKRVKLQALLSQLTYGLEVEQSGIGTGNRAVLNSINEEFQGRQKWRQVYDGSVSRGSEFVSGIMPWNSIEKTQEAVRKIRRGGGREHSSCGIHVHIDGSRFLRNPKALVRLIRIVNRYELLMFHALKADGLTEGQNRMEGSWAKPVCPRFLERIDALGKNPTIDQIKMAWYNGHDGSRSRYHSSRYRLLNLHALFSKGTIEFRCFNSTLHAGKIKSYIQLSGMICAQALLNKSAKKGKRTFSPEKAHYQVRTWLIKLGAVGTEYKTLLHHLTNHLRGNASYHREA